MVGVFIIGHEIRLFPRRLWLFSSRILQRFGEIVSSLFPVVQIWIIGALRGSAFLQFELRDIQLVDAVGIDIEAEVCRGLAWEPDKCGSDVWVICAPDAPLHLNWAHVVVKARVQKIGNDVQMIADAGIKPVMKEKKALRYQGKREF